MHHARLITAGPLRELGETCPPATPGRLRSTASSATGAAKRVRHGLAICDRQQGRMEDVRAGYTRGA